MLDALSLNLSSLASSIPSYQEIKNLTKKNKINLVKQNNQSKWVDNLNNLSKFDLKNKNNKRQRINNFKIFQNDFEKKYLLKIGEYLSNN